MQRSSEFRSLLDSVLSQQGGEQIGQSKPIAIKSSFFLNFFFWKTKPHVLTDNHEISNHTQLWDESRRRESLARPRTSSPELKPCENFKSVFPIFENFAYGKEYILANPETRRKLRNPRAHRLPFTIPKTFSTFSTNHCCRNSAIKKRWKRRFRRPWAEEMLTMHKDSSEMPHDPKRLEERSTHSIMSSAKDIRHSLTHYEISMTAYPCFSSSPTSPPPQLSPPK